MMYEVNYGDYILERFWEKIKVNNQNGCWEWQGSTSQGYGNITINKKRYQTHRLAYETNKGLIPKGMELDHLCRNRICCNPEHLEVVSKEENIRRGLWHKTINWQTLKMFCLRGHPLFGDNLYIDEKHKKRHCKTCRNLNYQKYKSFIVIKNHKSHFLETGTITKLDSLQASSTEE